ncbi:skin calcitonin gene-related peptide-like isoform X1 [Entelurus aequoreus]|uniref:skin calcitonin gene-related peptide-like isoform X1 n=1 Tax=Entelurus aequoreus TaxID=161455 RepID=UPI002B1D9176|nr:skin calcitonin gene-related peptide-like isoform X1 [Entelurus aequoreus]
MHGESEANLWTAPQLCHISTMYHLRVPALLLLLLVLLHCTAAAPRHRHFRSSSLGREENILPDDTTPKFLLSKNLFGLMATRSQRGLADRTSVLLLLCGVGSHPVEKKKCKTATCVTQRLADFLVRSSNTIGAVYAPTNVGSAAYGKRELPGHYRPL